MPLCDTSLGECVAGDSEEPEGGCCIGTTSKCDTDDKTVCDRASTCDWETDESLCNAEPEGGCCYGADSKCDTDDQATCERMARRAGCEWRAGDDADCSVAPGCCDVDDKYPNKFDACQLRGTDEASCEDELDCFWVSGADAVCEPPAELPGCCTSGSNPRKGWDCEDITTMNDCARWPSHVCVWVENENGCDFSDGDDDDDSSTGVCTSQLNGNPCPDGFACYFGECISCEEATEEFGHCPGNMCGGPGHDENCKDCMECSNSAETCKPLAMVDDCEPRECVEDDDCERNDVCYQNDCALPDRIDGACAGSSPRSGDCDGLSFMDCRDADDCAWADPEESVMTALVAPWQSANGSMALLAASAMLMLMVYAVYGCTKAKGSTYEPLAFEEC